MSKCIKMRRFMQALFDEETTADKAAEIGQAILAARSIRLTDIAAKMKGNSDASYKRIQRFIQQADPRQALWRLFQEEAEFVIGDPTEIERRQARKTAYVGTLKDGKTKGFWVMLLAMPYRGRAIPCGLVTYSSKTIATQQDSRNLNHFRAFEGLKDLLGERPLVLDREFSYLELLLRLEAERVNFVICLNRGSHPAKFYDRDGQEVALTISPGETVIHKRVWYKGQVWVNLIGDWGQGFSEPIWIMTNLDAKEGLRIYRARMKIEETNRDLKSLLGMTRLMNKQQDIMEKMLALLLLVFAIGLLVGEALRDQLYGERIEEAEVVSDEERIPGSAHRKKGKKWRRYSGLFILLKQKWSLPDTQWRALLQQALASFIAIVHYPVPTHV
ncbi:MAG: transposase [Anaerolineaceae bacterium]|nr:transposase [Anaerolineaceae bacterium]